MEENVIVIQNWSVTPAINDPYAAPESAGICINGEVYGHPDKKDGQLVTTSLVKKVDGRMVTTMSGHVYRLGKINSEYRNWIRKNYKKEWDWRNPIVVVSM